MIILYYNLLYCIVTIRKCSFKTKTNKQKTNYENCHVFDNRDFTGECEDIINCFYWPIVRVGSSRVFSNFEENQGHFLQ